jgi:hypothetical protein
VTSPHSDFSSATDDPWAGDDTGETTTGRRRRARGEKGFERELDSDHVADREDIVAVPVAPVRRVASLSIAIFGVLLGFALIVGGYSGHRPYGFVILGVQILFVLSWIVATRPPGPRVVAAVGLGAAALSDLWVALPTHATIAPLAYVTAAAFAAGAIGQLARKLPREQLMESLGATLMMVVGVVAFATLIVLSRHALGPESIAVCVAAAAIGIVVARLCDVVLPFPRTTPQVSRGTVGIVLGAMAATVAAAVVASAIKGMHPGHAVIAGLVVGVAAVLADLGVGYAEASREIEGPVSAWWVVRHMQGPLAAFALASPVAYVMSVMVLIPSLS